MPFHLPTYVSRFRRNSRGNVAIIFAIAAIPLISAVGCAVDYSSAVRMKAKLQAAADGASIAALSQKSPGFIAASKMTGNGAVTEGEADADNVFDANMTGSSATRLWSARALSRRPGSSSPPASRSRPMYR